MLNLLPRPSIPNQWPSIVLSYLLNFLLFLENAIKTLKAGPPLKPDILRALANTVVLKALKTKDVDSTFLYFVNLSLIL